MLSSIIEDTITKESDYLYINKENNNYIYYGFNICKNKIRNIEESIVYKLYTILSVNEKCIYIGNYQNYQVYLDKDNNIKHYLKDGIEDFIMLFKNNGVDSTLYLGGNSNKITKSKKIKINNYKINILMDKIFYIQLFCCSTLLSYITLNIISNGGNVFDTLKYESSKIVYKASSFANLNLEIIDYKEAINLIYSSELPKDTKDLLSNKELLQDVFKYYEGTNMEYIIKNRLNGIKIEVYDNYQFDNSTDYETLGYYNELIPNVLHMKKGSDKNKILSHEFIHLLQSPECEYITIKEACAEIISEEYLDQPITSYQSSVGNVKLLMDVIGEEPILKSIFSGDDSIINYILKKNLSDCEYNELTTLLKKSPSKITNDTIDNERINELISKLYKNITGTNIKNNRNIYDTRGRYINNNVYFNKKEEQKILLKSN